MKTKLLILALAAVGLVGCASGPSFREYAPNITAVPETQGRIYFYRTSTVGAGIRPNVLVNGQPVGKAIAKGFFFIDRPGGTYTVQTVTEVQRSLEIDLQPGEEKYVLLKVEMGIFVGRIKPVLVDSELGRAEITKTRYTGAQ